MILEDDVISAILEIERAKHLYRVAEVLLDDRAVEIFQRVMADDETRAEIGHDFDISGQRVGQIYKEALEAVHQALNEDTEFQKLMDSDNRSEIT